MIPTAPASPPPSPFARLRPDRADLGVALAILAGFALIRILAFRAGFAADPAKIPELWQTIALEDLDRDLLGSLLAMHAQPPLWNLLLGLAVKACGGPDAGCVTTVVHAAQMPLTPLIAGLTWATLRLAGVARGLAWGAAGLFAWSPGPLVYESFGLYMHLACALMAGVAFAFAAFARGWRPGAPLALGLTCLLCLLWPLFHPLFLPIVFAGLIATGGRRALARGPLLALALSLAVAFAPSAWNLHRHGMFTNGTWMGLTLTQTLPDATEAQKARCLFAGAMDDVAEARASGALDGLPAPLAKTAQDPGIAARSKECLAMATAEIAAHPLAWLEGRLAALARSHRLWSWEYLYYRPPGWDALPIPDVTRDGSMHAEGSEGLLLLAMFVAVAGGSLASLGLGLHGRRGGLVIALLLVVAAFTAVAHLFNGEEQNRMRHAIAPEWLMLAALTLDALRRRLARGSRDEDA